MKVWNEYVGSCIGERKAVTEKEEIGCQKLLVMARKGE